MKKTLLSALVIASFSVPVFADGYIILASGRPILVSTSTMAAIEAAEAERAAKRAAEKAAKQAAKKEYYDFLQKIERDTGSLFKMRF